ncbi:MAG: CarD family transcriptional regulator [Clostridiales bacterium]|nr:CarD family transcriptional regulator [Clostridiales bacterium]
MFEVGDKVLYPMHGAGVIEKIVEKEVLGERQDFYVMTLPFGDMSVSIPVEKMEDVGLRPVIEAEEARGVLREFGSAEAEESTNWNKRYRDNMMRIRSGDINEVSCVLFSLMKREHDKGLSTGERKMLISARQIFVSEISLSVGRSRDEIEELLADVFE